MEKYSIKDNKLEVYGRDLKELFENAGLALSSLMSDVKKIKPEIEEEFEIKGEDIESTLFNWLQGLITIARVEEKIFSKFKIKKVSETLVRAKMKGDSLKPEDKIVKIHYEGYNLEKSPKGYKLTVNWE